MRMLRTRHLLYYFSRMADNPKLKRPPEPAREAPTRMEGWYLECLRRWIQATGSAPTLHELAHLCKRSRSAVYSALISLEYKGHVVRGDNDRRFTPAGGQ
jgi:hypothetical protein